MNCESKIVGRKKEVGIQFSGSGRKKRIGSQPEKKGMEKRDSAQTFRDLIVWQHAHAFVLDVYRGTLSFPKEEIYGLTSQFRRAAISIPANIAEGFVKNSNADKIRFFNIAQGSLEECRYYILLAADLHYFSSEWNELNEQAERVSKLLTGLIKAMNDR